MIVIINVLILILLLIGVMSFDESSVLSLFAIIAIIGLFTGAIQVQLIN